MSLPDFWGVYTPERSQPPPNYQELYEEEKAKNARLSEELEHLRAENRALREKVEDRDGVVKYNLNIHNMSLFFRFYFLVTMASQAICKEIFADDESVCVVAYGSMLRKMFEFLTTPGHPSKFFEVRDFDFKIQCSRSQFLLFVRAFASFIYTHEMKFPGTDFVIVGIEKPIVHRSVISRDNHVIERMKFIVSFFCQRTKKFYKLDFSCDDGSNPDILDFDVNALVLDKKGIHAKRNGRDFPWLTVVRKIIDREAEWCMTDLWHISSIGRILKLSPFYRLFECPYICKTEFCAILQESSKWALLFSGCNCADVSGQERTVEMSVQGLLGFLEMLKKQNQDIGNVQCPMCRGYYVTMVCTEELDKKPQFDLSKLFKFPEPPSLKTLQEKSLTYAQVLSIANPDKSEEGSYSDIIRGFLSLAHQPHLQQIPPGSNDPVFFQQVFGGGGAAASGSP